MNILFVSKYNTVRSKLAEAYFNKHNKLKQLHAQSAGLFRGAPTAASVMEAARLHRLSLKTSQSAMSTYLLEKHDLVILVADDVPTSIFRKDNPYVKAFVWWKVPAPNERDDVSIETAMKDIERRVQTLLQELGQETKTMESLDRVLFDLRRLQDSAVVAEWARIGHPAKKFYGVDPIKLKAIAKQYKGDRTLAQGLWKTGIHDARVLAPMVENPAEVTEHQVETWLRQADFWDITDKIATEILPHTDYGFEKIRTWVRENNPWCRRSGWVLLDRLAKTEPDLADKDLERLIDMIPKTINKEDPWVAEAMLHAIIGVGRRNKRLYQRAKKIASKVGDVKINYGDPRIKAPNPLERLARIPEPEE